jgi:hypothetical protein
MDAEQDHSIGRTIIEKDQFTEVTVFGQQDLLVG